MESLSLHYKKTTELRLEPYEMLAPFDRIGVGDAFYVLDRKDDWIMIQPRGKRAGWIRYKTTDEALELEDIRGLVKLAQGIMQYFAGSYHAAIETLNEYQSIYASEQDVQFVALNMHALQRKLHSKVKL